MREKKKRRKMGRFVLPARQVSHVDDGVESAFFSCVRVCVCVHIYTYIHSHVHIYIFIYIYMRVCLCVCGICSMRASTHTMHSLREGVHDVSGAVLSLVI